MDNKDLSIRETVDKANQKSELDHIVIASPDLEALVEEFYNLTGVKL